MAFILLMPLVGILLVALLGKILSFSAKAIGRLVANGIIGTILLFVVNILGAGFGLSIKFTVLNALVAGFFGVPGVLVLLLLG